MTAQLKALVTGGGTLEKRAGNEALPVHQSTAYSSWHYEAKWRVDEAWKVLKDRRTYAVVLEDGSDTRNEIAEAIRKIEETREQCGPPDDTERRKKDQEQARTGRKPEAAESPCEPRRLLRPGGLPSPSSRRSPEPFSRHRPRRTSWRGCG